MRKLAAALLAFALAGCQTAPPTKVTESRERGFLQVRERAERPFALRDNTVVLDARSRFDYGLNHVLNSINFPWENLAEDSASGRVLKDSRQAALRLSLVGARPESSVVVIGYGPNGHGEAGRLAWNLLYLGFQDVEVASEGSIHQFLTSNATPPTKNAPLWKPVARDDLQIGKAEFLNLMDKPKAQRGGHVHVIDVRSEAEYLRHPGDAKLAPDLNIEWKNFYNTSGRPDTRFRAKVVALGLAPDDRIVVISNHGVRSGAAAFALFALGYTHVENFTGGWDSLSKD